MDLPAQLANLGFPTQWLHSGLQAFPLSSYLSLTVIPLSPQLTVTPHPAGLSLKGYGFGGQIPVNHHSLRQQLKKSNVRYRKCTLQTCKNNPGPEPTQPSRTSNFSVCQLGSCMSDISHWKAALVHTEVPPSFVGGFLVHVASQRPILRITISFTIKGPGKKRSMICD